MDKIRKSTGLKVLAVILMSVVITVTLGSAFVASVLLKNNIATNSVITKQDILDLKQDIMEEQMSMQMQEAVWSCYHPLLENTNAEMPRRFDEEHTNMAFIIEPLNSSEDLPRVSNYKLDTCSYQLSQTYMEDYNYSEELFQYKLPVQDILVNWSLKSGIEKEEVVYTEIYNDEFISDNYLDPNSVWVDDNVDEEELNVYCYFNDERIEYNLKADRKFVNAWKKFLSQIGDDRVISSTCTYYNADDETVCINVGTHETAEVVVSGYLRPDLTVKDNFYYYSALLDFVGFVGENCLVILTVSLLLVIALAIFLGWAAGYSKKYEEIHLTRFDKIPLDIILLIEFFAVGCLISCFAYGGMRNLVFIVVLDIIAALSAPLLLWTLAARLKKGHIFKNTIIARLIKLLARLGKGIANGAKITGAFLRDNFNIYWKYVGAYGLLSLAELILIVASSFDAEGPFVFVVIEKIIVTAVLIIALVNMNRLKQGAKNIADGDMDYVIDTRKMFWEFKKHGENINRIGDGIQAAVDEKMKSERMKTELITNVSHDIKTPLTSIISYVDLLDKQNIADEKSQEYIEVLKRQSGKMKKLIEDLIDAAKASTGNMKVELEELDVRVILEQAVGEFESRFKARGLRPVVNISAKRTYTVADGKLLWRVIDNLLGNICKYAEENSRVYIDVESMEAEIGDCIAISMKNISREQLNISGEELMERFVRGDASRNTEGSGLGLSIAKSLVELQNGKMDIIVDGDLFKVIIYLEKVK